MSDESIFTDNPHCGRVGCTCLHLWCDKGFTYASDRVVERGGRTVEYERVRPCPSCKPDSYAAALRAKDRADFMRRLRSVRPDAKGREDED